jgi:hypothetical protein
MGEYVSYIRLSFIYSADFDKSYNRERWDSALKIVKFCSDRFPAEGKTKQLFF